MDRRYGLSNSNPKLHQAWRILAATAYACPRSQQGTVENLICAYPSFDAKRASSWGPEEGYWFDDAQLVKAHKAGLCVGISVAETPGLVDPEEKLKDIIESFSIAYRAADYIEINVSCPNTGESRVDLDMSFSERIFTEIMNFRNGLGLRKAVYAKLSPDLSERHLISIMDMLVRTGVNGVVIGNTYPTAKLSELPVNAKFEDLTPLRADGDCGGMSGRPLFENMVWNVKYIREHYPQMSIIACGGIDHGYKIYDLIKLGVDAVQCYSVVAFRWMAAHAMRNELMDAMLNDGYKSLGEYDDRNPRK